MVPALGRPAGGGMPVFKGWLGSDGALVPVRVNWSRIRTRTLRAALRPIPAAVDTQALLDSGAESSCIAPSLTRALQLPMGTIRLVNFPISGSSPIAIE